MENCFKNNIKISYTGTTEAGRIKNGKKKKTNIMAYTHVHNTVCAQGDRSAWERLYTMLTSRGYFRGVFLFMRDTCSCNKKNTRAPKKGKKAKKNVKNKRQI